MSVTLKFEQSNLLAGNSTVVFPLSTETAGGSRLDGILSDYGKMLKDLTRPWSEAYTAWTDALRPEPWGGKSHPRGCRSPRCEPDDCRCRCCVGFGKGR